MSMTTDKYQEYLLDARNDDISSCCGSSLYNGICSSCGEHSGTAMQQAEEGIDFQDAEADKAYHEGMNL